MRQPPFHKCQESQDPLLTVYWNKYGVARESLQKAEESQVYKLMHHAHCWKNNLSFFTCSHKQANSYVIPLPSRLRWDLRVLIGTVKSWKNISLFLHAATDTLTMVDLRWIGCSLWEFSLCERIFPYHSECCEMLPCILITYKEIKNKTVFLLVHDWITEFSRATSHSLS